MSITENISETTRSLVSTTASELSTPTEDHTAEGALMLFPFLSVGVDII